MSRARERQVRGLVVLDGQLSQPSTPEFYDFKVRTGLGRHDCIRFCKHIWDYVASVLKCSVLKKQGII